MNRSVLLLFITLTLASCNHKDLCDDHPHTQSVKIIFDWEKSPEANPRGMCVWFYRQDGAPLRYDFSGREGGDILLPMGSYQVIAYNNDTEAVMMRGENAWSTHEAFTREGDVLEPVLGSGFRSDAPRAEGERVVMPPDMLWGASVVTVVVDSGTHEIVLCPESAVCHYTCEIRNVSNLKYISHMCASLSGLSPSLMMSTATSTDERVTIPFATIHDGNATIRGEFLTFGCNTAGSRSNRLLLYVWLRDGRKLCYGSESERFEVSDQILRAPDRRNVHIIIDGLDMPAPIENGDGFDPSVDDWDIVNQDIEM